MRKSTILSYSLLIFSLFLLTSCQSETVSSQDENDSKKVKIAQVTEIQMGKAVVLEGELLPSTAIELYAELEGRISNIHVEIGQVVSQGETLIELKDSELELQLQKGKLLQEKAKLQVTKNESDQKAALIQAQKQLEKAQLQLDAAIREYDRMKDIDTPAQQLDSLLDRVKLAEMDWALANQQLEVTQSELNARLLDLSVREANLAVSEVEQLLQKRTIQAPVDGVVAEINTIIGQQISPGVSLARLEVYLPLHVQFVVTEQDLSYLRGLDQVMLHMPLLNQDFPVNIKSIQSMVSQQRSGFLVTFSLETKANQEELYPGLNTQLKLYQDREESVLAVPISALTERNGKSVVYKYHNEKAYLQEVKLGRKNNEYVEVLSGLQPNDQVITLGVGLLEHEDKVDVLE